MMTTSSEYSCFEIISEAYNFTDAENQGLLRLLDISGVSIDFLTQYPKCLEVHDELIQKTQELLFARSGERWNSAAPQWIMDNSDEVLQIAEQMHLADEVSPTKGSHFDCAAIFGATAPTMGKRTEYLEQSLKEYDISINEVYFLVGERYVDLKKPQSDGGIEYIREVAKNSDKTEEKITETDFARYISANFIENNDHFKETPVHFIDTPKGEKTRPDTQDTLIKFLESLDSGDYKTILFVSNAPNIKAQAATTAKIMHLYDKENRQYEVVGEKYKIDINNAAKSSYEMISPFAKSLFEDYEHAHIYIAKKLNQCVGSYHDLSEYKEKLKFKR